MQNAMRYRARPIPHGGGLVSTLSPRLLVVNRTGGVGLQYSPRLWAVLVVSTYIPHIESVFNLPKSERFSIVIPSPSRK